MFIERYLCIKSRNQITLKARTVITFWRGKWDRPMAGRGQEAASGVVASSVLMTWVVVTELLVLCTIKYTFLCSLLYLT